MSRWKINSVEKIGPVMDNCPCCGGLVKNAWATTFALERGGLPTTIEIGAVCKKDGTFILAGGETTPATYYILQKHLVYMEDAVALATKLGIKIPD